MPLYLGNKLMSEEYLGLTNVSLEFKFPPIDIVRDGLLYAFDWTSFNGDGTLTDRSSNGYNATYSGSLTVSNSNLQFDGTSSYIQMSDNAKSGAYNSWQWTIDTYGSLYPQTITTGSDYGRIIAANLGPDGGIEANWDYPLIDDTPWWQFGLFKSGSNAPELTMWNELTNARNTVTASLNSSQFTYLGVSSSAGSTISTWYDANQLPTTKFNGTIIRTFDISLTNQYNLTSSIQTFGGPRVNETTPFGRIDWLPLSASIKYIAYYNRPLTNTELAQNNEFYLSGNPIP